jgi:hypothetical protein
MPTAPGTAGTSTDRVTRPSPGRRYARFLSLAVAIVLGLGAVGFVPTRRMAGGNALTSMAAGCVIGLVAAALAGWLLIAVESDTPQARMQRAAMAMFCRLSVAAILGLAAALSGEVARMPMLFWLATTYVVLLPLEVKLAIENA